MVLVSYVWLEIGKTLFQENAVQNNIFWSQSITEDKALKTIKNFYNTQKKADFEENRQR